MSVRYHLEIFIDFFLLENFMIIEACCMRTFGLLRFQIKFGKCRNLLLFEQFTAQVASKSKKSINNATTPHV